MNLTEQEIFEQIGRLYMQNVKLAADNARLCEALEQKPGADDEPK